MITVLPYFKCPTGNCTFGNFASLGVCSSCVDISSEVEGEIRRYAVEGNPWKTDYEFAWADAGILRIYENVSWDIRSTPIVETTHSFSDIMNSTTFIVFGILQSQPDFASNTNTRNATVPKVTE